MRVHVWRDRDVAIVEPIGEVHTPDVGDFREALARAHRLATRSAVVVALDSVRYLDAEALAEVFLEHRRLRAAGGQLALTGVGPSLRRLLAFTSLDSVVPAYESLEDALRVLGSPAVR